ncbi:MAG TPA: pyridoxal-dependent decarboxylase [Pyrinomonadaceae bacterium]|jgi:glutamate/tyrosine decarboxylase-like PLP-dependent enzyme
MKNKIRQLEKLSRLLEPTSVERKNARDEVVNYTENFLQNIEKKKAYKITSKKGAALLDSPIAEEPAPIDELIKLLKKNVDRPGLNPASGGHLGYIPGGGLYYSALGDYMADIFNRYTGMFSTGPGAVRMENMLIRWMAEIVGYPKDAAGNLTTGGSLAHLTGVVTARDAKGISSKDVKRSVIYFSEQTHHSIEKAIRIAGLDECQKRSIPLDDRYRIVAIELEKKIELDKECGLNPFLVVATAGTTDVGAVDPLEEIGAICQRHNLWYHIDAAYGGFFILTDDGQKTLRGIELADSLVMDPHKGLFLPYGLGVILVKDKKALRDSLYYPDAHYLPERNKEEEPSPCDLSLELTKHFRGLRLWLPLKLHGVKPFRACLEEKLLLAKYFYREVKKLGFEVDPEQEPELSVVTYRYVPKQIAHDAKKVNKFNEDLLEKLQEDGRVFISSTSLKDEKYVLRFACLSFRTHLKTIVELLKILKEKVEMLEKII